MQQRQAVGHAEMLCRAAPAGASLPSSNTPVSLSGSGMPSAQPSQAPSMQQGTRKLLRQEFPPIGITAPQLYPKCP